MTYAELIQSYLTDPDSPYQKVEHASRNQYDKLCKRLTADVGNRTLAQTTARELQRWHADWAAASGIPMAHALVTMLRMLTGFGATLLGEPESQRVRGLLGLMRFPAGQQRQDALTFEQVAALCDLAMAKGMYSIALAQAFQFEALIRQKDAIGSWVPGPNGPQWIKGIRWEEIDSAMVLRHVTSKRKKKLTVDLKLLPLVMKCLRTNMRHLLPASGPVIVCEQTGLPWSENSYRYQWRRLARLCGISDHIQNRDSRAGGITEALAAGAQPDDVRKGATHSQLSTTLIYSRSEEEAVARVMQKRIEARST